MIFCYSLYWIIYYYWRSLKGNASRIYYLIKRKEKILYRKNGKSAKWLIWPIAWMLFDICWPSQIANRDFPMRFLYRHYIIFIIGFYSVNAKIDEEHSNFIRDKRKWVIREYNLCVNNQQQTNTNEEEKNDKNNNDNNNNIYYAKKHRKQWMQLKQ